MANAINDEGINEAEEETKRAFRIDNIYDYILQINYVDDNSFGSEVKHIDILE